MNVLCTAFSVSFFENEWMKFSLVEIFYGGIHLKLVIWFAFDFSLITMNATNKCKQL